MSKYYILQSSKIRAISNEKALNNNADTELIILKIPQTLLIIKHKRKNYLENLKKKKKRYDTSNVEVNNIKKDKYSRQKEYFERLNKSTQKCVEILNNNFNINRHDIYNGKNFFCPFHENRYKSKSASARFITKKNIFKCYSTNCVLRKNKSSCMNSINFLKLLYSIDTAFKVL